MTLSANTLQEMSTHLNASLAAASVAAVPAFAAAAVAPPVPPQPLSGFCAIWKDAKPVLTFLASIIGLIPGAGTGAAAALNALISLGNEICPNV